MPRNIIRSGGNGKLIGYVRPSFKYIPSDSDAQTYILAVEAVDGQVLENNVRMAIDNFVKGCKDDDIWNSIKSCCILSGARTLDGALIPLKGTAPTNNNFISTDYDRKTGLKGNGSNKYLNTNRAANADPLFNKHVSLYLSELNSSLSSFRYYLGDSSSTTYMYSSAFSSPAHSSINGNVNGGASGGSVSNVGVGFKMISRWPQTSPTSSPVKFYLKDTEITLTLGVANPTSIPLYIFANNANNTPQSYSNARIAFYSIGESINSVGFGYSTTLLRNRVDTLISVFNTL